MRSWALFLLGLAAALTTVAFVGQTFSVPPAVTAVAFGLIVVASGLGTRVLVSRRRRAMRSGSADSVEQDLAQRAAARTLPVAILALVAMSTWFVIDGALHAAAVGLGAVVLVVVAHWVIYATDRHRTLSQTGPDRP